MCFKPHNFYLYKLITAVIQLLTQTHLYRVNGVMINISASEFHLGKALEISGNFIHYFGFLLLYIK